LKNCKNTISEPSVGYSMYTIPSNVSENMLKKIMEEDIPEVEILQEEREGMEFCNLDLVGLKGYYYDKDGNIYFEPGLQFHLRIKHFQKLFNKK